ncbi:hypothetical protein HDZ31DRAFT_60454 [Schizophyllum fasciatum]
MTTIAAVPRIVLIPAEDRDIECQRILAPMPPRRERKGTLPPYSPRAMLAVPATRKTSLDTFRVIDLADCASSAPHSTASAVVPCTYPPTDIEAARTLAAPSVYPDEKHPQPRQPQYLLVPARQPWIMHVVTTRQSLRRGLLMGSWVACVFLMGLAAVLVFAQAKL